MTDPMAAFVRARLGEEREEAQRGYLHAPELPDHDGWDKSTTAGLPPAVAARVVADIDKRLLIVEAFERANEGADFPNYEGGYASGLEYAVQVEASRFDDHPDYLPEWKP